MLKTAISSLFLVLAASAVSAEPTKDETAERVSYTEPEGATEAQDGWVEIASPTPARNGRTFITVDGRYAQLRVDATRPVVRSVRIVYADGTQKTVKLRGKRSSVIDLAAAPVEHIVVDSNSRAKGTFTVHAAAAEGVAVR